MKKLTTNFLDTDNEVFKYKRVIKLRMLYVKNLISWVIGIRIEYSKPKPIFLNVVFKEEEFWGVGEQEEYEDELRNKLSGYNKSLRNRLKELLEIFDTNETYESMDNVYKNIRSLLYNGYREFYIKCDNRSDAVAIQENIWSWVSESKVENIKVKITFC